MSTTPLFTSMGSIDRPRVLIELDGQPLSVLADISLAAALLEAGVGHSRRAPVSGAARGAYCLMGVCFDCLVHIEGTSQRACQVLVRPDLRVQRHLIATTAGERHE